MEAMPLAKFCQKKETQKTDYFRVNFRVDSAWAWRLAKRDFICLTMSRCWEDLAKLVYSLGSR